MPGPVTNRTRTVAKRVRALPQDVVTVAAGEIADATLARCRADLGGDARFSGMGSSGPRLDVETKTASGGDAAVVVVPSNAGIVTILEEGTRPHRIGSKRPGSRAIRVAGTWITGPVTVSGSPAKRSWSRGIEDGRPAAVRAAHDELGKAVADG